MNVHKGHCKYCGEFFGNFKEELQRNAAGVIMVRGDCPKCERWLLWVPYNQSVLVKKALDEYYDAHVKNDAQMEFDT